MKQFKKEDVELALMPKGTMNFADIVARLRRDKNLGETRKRDLISGINRASIALHRQPEAVPCDPPWLQDRLAKISPASLGLTPKTWQNHVSNARAALAYVGIVEPRLRTASDLTPEWQALWQTVKEAGDTGATGGLRRFIHFLNNLDIMPKDVTTEIAEMYRAALIANEIVKDPEVSYRATVSTWNLTVKRYSDWPQATIERPSRKFKIARPLVDY
ncbi:MAG: hypothetical protein EOP21_07410, partial [Hyphomicrobiales bacterium]